MEVIASPKSMTSEDRFVYGKVLIANREKRCRNSTVAGERKQRPILAPQGNWLWHRFPFSGLTQFRRYLNPDQVILRRVCPGYARIILIVPKLRDIIRFPRYAIFSNRLVSGIADGAIIARAVS
jgi:hypothetical protein